MLRLPFEFAKLSAFNGKASEIGPSAGPISISVSTGCGATRILRHNYEPGATKAMAAAAVGLVGDGGVGKRDRPSLRSADFSFMSERVGSRPCPPGGRGRRFAREAQLGASDARWLDGAIGGGSRRISRGEASSPHLHLAAVTQSIQETTWKRFRIGSMPNGVNLYGLTRPLGSPSSMVARMVQ